MNREWLIYLNRLLLLVLSVIWLVLYTIGSVRGRLSSSAGWLPVAAALGLLYAFAGSLPVGFQRPSGVIANVAFLVILARAVLAESLLLCVLVILLFGAPLLLLLRKRSAPLPNWRGSGAA